MNYIALNRHPSFYRNQLSRKKIVRYCQNSYLLGHIPYVINIHRVVIGCKIKAFRSYPVLTSHTYYRHHVIPKCSSSNSTKDHQVKKVFLQSKYYLQHVFIHKVVQRKGGRSLFTKRDHFHTLCRFRAIFSQSTRIGTP